MLYYVLHNESVLQELARLLKPGGRALLLGTSAPGGVADACLKVARGRQRSLWRVEDQVHCQAGGVPCRVVILISIDQSNSNVPRETVVNQTSVD